MAKTEGPIPGVPRPPPRYAESGPSPRLASASTSYTSRSGPPSKNDVLIRQGTAVLLIILLYTASIPFTPVAWIVHSAGSSFLDRLFAGIVLLSACYFQWQIAGITRPLAIMIPGASGTTIRNGRIEKDAPVVGFIYRPSDYWSYAITEAVLLGMAEFGPSELLRQSVVCATVAALWVIGYAATPETVKQWVYHKLKAYIFWLVLDEAVRVGARSGGRRRHRF